MADKGKTYELTVEPRQLVGKASRRLRKQGLIPGVLYGYQIEAQPVQVPLRELERVYLHAGSTTLVDLRIAGDGPARKVFIYNIQRDPVTHRLAHVDFMAPNLRAEVTASVPLLPVGQAPAVEQGIGLLLQGLDHVEVRALPTDLPHAIEVDISRLESLDDVIHVSDLTVPDGVVILTPGEEMVAKVVPLPTIEVEEEVEEVEEAAVPEAEVEPAEGMQPAGTAEEETES
jgi:large subunit ribosomal protein L25